MFYKAEYLIDAKWCTTLLACLLLIVTNVLAQKSVTQKQHQVIQEIAIDRVEVFTKYMALLAKEQDNDKRKAYEKYIALSFKKQETPIRVYNDLLPLSVIEGNPILDQHVFLDAYLKQTTENYGNLLNVSFKDHKVRNVCYSDYLKQYYVVVTAMREISGYYRNGVQLIENKAVYPIDFFVHLEIGKEDVKVGSLFGFEPHKERQNYQSLVINTPVADQVEGVASFRDNVKVENTKRKIRIKRGKSYILKWSGGLADDIIEVELIPIDDHVDKTIYFEPLRNENSARVLIHEGVKTGHYKFRVTNVTTGRYTQTGHVKIKKKFLFFGSATDKITNPADAAFYPIPVKKPVISSNYSTFLNS